MPRLIPVIDVLGGQAVHARAGRRADYLPVRSILRRGSDPLELATTIRDAFGIRELYLADLDAIGGSAPATPLYRKLAGLGLSLWIDAGLRDGTRAKPLLDAGAARLVVGLETVRGREGLREVVAEAGLSQVVFSLDLREGKPIIPRGAVWGTEEPRAIAGIAIGLGVRSLILLDLGHVGMGRGVGTRDLLEALYRQHPGVEWVVGGGISGPGDIQTLGLAGAGAVLVASALHDGRLRAEDFGLRTV